MILRPCPYCSKEIPRSITVCPYCHRDEKGQQVVVDPPPTRTLASKVLSERDLSELSNDDPYIREQAVDRLSKMGIGVVPTLIRVLSDQSKSGLVGIAKILGRLRDPRAIAVLSDAAQRGHDELRTTAVWALGQFKDPDALTALMREAPRPPVALQSYVAYTIGGFSDSRGIETLVKLSSHLDREVAFQAVYALGELDDRRAVKALRKAYRRPDILIRSSAEASLRRLKVSLGVQGKNGRWIILGVVAAIVIAACAWWLYR